MLLHGGRNARSNADQTSPVVHGNLQDGGAAMKRLRTLIVPISVLAIFFGLAVTGANAQILKVTDIAGKFTLPFEAQWGRMTLPAGNYNLYYGSVTKSGLRVVEVAGEDWGTLHGVVLPMETKNPKGEGNFLVCVFEGNRAFVRSLQMAEIGQSVGFARPHGVSVSAWIMAGKESHNTNTKLAETRIPVVPVK